MILSTSEEGLDRDEGGGRYVLEVSGFWELVVPVAAFVAAIIFVYQAISSRCPKCHRFFVFKVRSITLKGEKKLLLYACRHCGHEGLRKRSFLGGGYFDGGGNGGGNGG